MTLPNPPLNDVGVQSTNRTRSGLMALGLGSRPERVSYYQWFVRMPLIQPPSRRIRVAEQLGLNWYPDWNQDGSIVHYIKEEV